MILKKLGLKISSASRVKKSFFAVLLVLIIAVMSLTTIIATEAGSHWLVQKLASVVPLQVTGLHGRLLTGFDIQSLDYHEDDISVHIEKIHFRWQPLGLLYTSLNVQSLSAEKVRITLPAHKQSSPPTNEWPNFAQPVRITLQKMRINNVEIQQGDTLTAFSTITGNLSLGTFHLRTTDFTVASAQGQIKLNGAVGLRYPYTLALDAEWMTQDNSVPPGLRNGKIHTAGDIQTLTVKTSLIYPLKINVSAKLLPALREPKGLPHAEILIDWKEQPLPVDWEPYANLSVGTPDESKQPNQSASLTHGNISIKGWLEAFDIASDIAVNSESRKSSLVGVVHGNYSAEKKLLHAQLNPLTLSVQPTTDKTQRQNIISIKGELEGLTAWQWNIALTTEHFDLNPFIANWPSDLHIGFDLQGKFDPQQRDKPAKYLNISFNNINAQGDLRGHRVAAEGDLQFDGEHWRSSAANLAIGANQFLLKGSAGNLLAVDWKINAPLLEQIDPALRGSLISNGNLSGTKANPQIRAKADAKKISWHDYAVESLSLDVKPKANTQDYDAALIIKNAQLQGYSVLDLSITASGTPEQHIINADILSPALGRINFSLNSAWQNDIWRGRWLSLAISIKGIPQWTMASSQPIHVNTALTTYSADMGKLCLTSSAGVSRPVNTKADSFQRDLPQAQQTQKNIAMSSAPPAICVAGKWNELSGVQLDGSLSAVPVSQFQPWLRPEAVLYGFVEGQLKLQAPPGKPLSLDAHLASRDARIFYQFQDGKSETYTLQKSMADLTIKNNVLATNVLMDWGRYGLINATAKYSLSDKKIQGTLSAELHNIAPLESVLPFLNEIKGSASANVAIAGTSSKPELSGKISLNDASANMPKLGLALRNVSVQLTSPRAGQVHLDGQITSGEGTLMLRGDVDNLGTPQWTAQSNIYGANIRFIEQPQMIANVSPNLKLSANANAINLTGSTEIPWARLALKTLPASATRLSSDVVVIQNDQRPSTLDSKLPIPFLTNIILYFGDDVRFKGFGLDTQLLGKVNVLKEENRQTFVTGFVGVGKGNYKAYGQDLVIERGRLIFQGPYDNPGLDIRATRILESGTAGLEIGGTLQHPKSTVFAVPAKTDSQAMAMLLTGKELSESSQADAYSLIGAIGGLGMDNGDAMTSDIAHFFHIDEISINADKGLDQSALLMGKYLTPKLFIRYIVGLFDQTFSLGVRYQLNDKLRLEAESGKNQSVDVIYKIER